MSIRRKPGRRGKILALADVKGTQAAIDFLEDLAARLDVGPTPSQTRPAGYKRELDAARAAFEAKKREREVERLREKREMDNAFFAAIRIIMLARLSAVVTHTLSARFIGGGKAGAYPMKSATWLGDQDAQPSSEHFRSFEQFQRVRLDDGRSVSRRCVTHKNAATAKAREPSAVE